MGIGELYLCLMLFTRFCLFTHFPILACDAPAVSCIVHPNEFRSRNILGTRLGNKAQNRSHRKGSSGRFATLNARSICTAVWWRNAQYVASLGVAAALQVKTGLSNLRFSKPSRLNPSQTLLNIRGVISALQTGALSIAWHSAPSLNCILFCANQTMHGSPMEAFSGWPRRG